MHIVIVANSLHANTLTGGDKIFVECAKKWLAMGHRVTIITNVAGVAYCIAQGMPKENIVAWSMSGLDRYVYIAMLYKTLVAFVHAFFTRLDKADVIFASSFFFPDMMPAFILRLRNAQAKLVTAFYIFTSRPWGTDYIGGRLKGLLFCLNENIAVWLIKHLQGMVLVASLSDKRRFAQSMDFPEKHILQVGGGVDNAFFRSVPRQPILYDAVFVGRFHPQKCIPELISIWGKIVSAHPGRRLAIIGGGPLEKSLHKLVRQKHLDHAIAFLGVMDGVEKAKILKSSRLFVSASRFDTGNIALDEALAAGVPGVIYDLPELAYPMGVVKVPTGDEKLFAQAIIDLLTDDARRSAMAKDALRYAKTIDWKQKAKNLLMSFDMHR